MTENYRLPYLPQKRTTWTVAMYPTKKQRRTENVALAVLAGTCLALAWVVRRA